MSELKTTTLPLLPLNHGVVLPGMVVTMALESAEARAAVEAAQTADGLVVLVPKLEGTYAKVGTITKIEDAGELPSGIRAVVARGIGRGVIGSGVPGPGTAVWVQVDRVVDGEPTAEAVELARRYRAIIENILEHRGAAPMAEIFRGLADPGAVADIAGYSPDLSFEQKVELLETVDVEERLGKVCEWANGTLADLSLKERINHDVAEGMEKTQREFMLRQQMAAIRRELGEGEDSEGLVAEYRRRLAESGAPQGVVDAAEKEIDRLDRTSEQSPEHGWIRTWLDTLLDVPWGKSSHDNLDLTEARAVLDADHTGLDDVKDRIIEYLGVRKLRADRGLAPTAGRGSGAIVALIGPPGVGKTSLGESVARALGRSFVRIALGGVRDEAEIRGHRRTYVGAQPGRIVRALREAGTMNPVFVLDEVDKVGSDWRGDPSSALLEVLDPAQNHTFRDHYLEVDLDLSDVVFLATANVLDTIPGPLLDRMEVIPLDGYTEAEKVSIARHHLLSRQLERNGLEPSDLEVTDAALRTIVSSYTREAGVRTLEREIGKMLRKVATRIASPGEGERGDRGAVVVDEGDVATYLGRPRHHFEAAERTSVPGVATGLAVTGAGGDVLFVEATALPGEPGLTLTGQLGDVMKESAEIALSWARANLPDAHAVRERIGPRFHVHVPAGAIPKDGPSAGITMATAIASLLTGRAVRASVAMTGEVTLQGRVLPIGGVKQKVLAAHRSGLSEVILPAHNGPDLDDVPESVRSEIRFHLVEDMTDVLGVALEPEAFVAAA